MKVDSSNALQILLLIGGLSIVPALLFTVTGFTRILIVLGFIRQALGTQNTPPNQVLVGIALFLTLFVMFPTIKAIKNEAYEPLSKHQITMTQALERGQEPLREFMFKQTRSQDLSLFVGLAKLKTAFQIGFLIFLPFLVIDLVVSTTLMSMGMMMLPPALISLPFKILLFVLVDGWDLVTRSLVESFR